MRSLLIRFLLTFLSFLFSSDIYSQENEEEVFSFVQEEPSFPAGDEAMYKYLKENIKYPKVSKDKITEGVTLVYFIIEKNGTLSGLKIIKGMSEELNQEIIRVIKSMPFWIPGMQNGKRVRVEKILTLKFSSKGKLLEAK